MAPTAGIADYLFTLDGTIPTKVNSAGAVTNWGFDIPASKPTATAVAGGSLADATWSYQITYYNSTTGHRSNGNGSTVTATTSGANNSVQLTSIPDPTGIDAQISHVEIWRSVADGDALFFLKRITAGTTTYTDTGSITLSSTELPTDNGYIDANAFDCLGSHNASMFILYGDTGTRGRVYYSPIGRAESIEGWITVCENDDPLNKLFRFQGQLGVIGEAGIYLIGGENPYVSRQISGCPGTTAPGTVVIIPTMGVMYEASDGVRLFNGTSSELVLPGTVERLFRGEALAGLTSFTGVVAAFCRDDYIISDTSQSLAFNLTHKRWRDLGIGINGIFYDTENNVIAATISSKVLSFEAEGSTDDDGVAILFSVEPGHMSFNDDMKRILQRVTFDIGTNNNAITVTLIHDGSETLLGTINNASRSLTTINVGITGRQFGIRLTGSLTNEINLYKIIPYFNDLNDEVI